MSSFKKQVPNLLTLSRLLITPIIFWLVIRENNYPALALILWGAVSDMLDGILARRLNTSSWSGYFFDHIVDGIYLIPIAYSVFRYLNFWLFLAVVLLEIATPIPLFLPIRKGQGNWPNIWGKLSYGFFIGSSCVGLLSKINEPITYFLWLGNIALMITIIFRTASFAVFLRKR